jgi:hypothetical protein
MKIKDWSERLVWATILVGVVRYAAAFAASDVGQITGIWSNILTILLSITGIGMGILDTVGGGLLFNGWSRVFPKVGQRGSLRFKVLTLCVFGLLFSGMFILVPFTMSRISQESVLDALGGKSSGWAWAWSAMVNLIPYILIAGVFTGNKMVSELESGQVSSNSPESSKKLSNGQENDEKVARNLPTDWRKIKESLTTKQVEFIASNEPKEIVKAFAKSGFDVSPRTASNWRIYAADELQIRLNK